MKFWLWDISYNRKVHKFRGTLSYEYTVSTEHQLLD